MFCHAFLAIVSTDLLSILVYLCISDTRPSLDTMQYANTSLREQHCQSQHAVRCELQNIFVIGFH